MSDLWLMILNFLPYVLLAGFIFVILRQQGKGGWARLATDQNVDNTERIASCLEKHGEVLEAMLIEFKAIRGLLEENRNK